MDQGYIISISRVETGKVKAESSYYVSDIELKAFNKNIGLRVIQGKVERALLYLNFNQLYMECANESKY